ncbi:MAG: aminotransferase class III-fold pyridoxal phosphate-dependent enzyme [Dehalococcoidia bacterium]
MEPDRDDGGEEGRRRRAGRRDLAKEAIAGVFQPGDHGSTFGGNPLATAAGYAVLKHIIDTDLPRQVKEKGERLMAKLRGLEDRHGVISEVRGRGLLCGSVRDRYRRGGRPRRSRRGCCSTTCARTCG